MNIQEYVDLIKETMSKNGVEWDTTTAHLAVYKYIKSPAISNYYHNFEFDNLSHNRLLSYRI